MNQSRKLELWVGSFIILGILAALFMVFKVADVRSLGSQDNYKLKAYFDNIGSLKVRSPVKVGGVVVGRVADITLDTEYYTPVVTLTIEERYGHFPDTSSAHILTSGLIGEQYISLIPGFIDEDAELLKDGDKIEDTKSALVLEDLIGQFMYSLGDGSGK
ncbi:outer membrane lipid asymmetry maintenance protein MlaD [Vibrio sp. UCD-FRSSP16_10]|uniref:outer membrane lipid asymmetry maintenance protein MlaD n=1 Tax=unclassified Vibrio TaxID=2614977 RepID=UPI0007FCC222|nr:MULTISPECIES: outer membrane lipid asymmetry maintenance protein MlaD [unclassified Vibrio]OBT17412.1 outer membrane lipid asymmetry maintenance protein MlaD [Vibrio sp. UCD-FRSSP16_30]OBT23181.1 outer membrane lipid asymmetry maintenance protein MlaD [Vibrio sp. UCD-FRSSP16_10]